MKIKNKNLFQNKLNKIFKLFLRELMILKKLYKKLIIWKNKKNNKVNIWILK